MKTVILSAILLSGIGFQAQAQLKLGVKAGANLATLHATYKGSVNDDGVQYKNKVDVVAGAMAQLPVIGKLSLQAEALYNRKGGKYESLTSPNGTLALSYFSIPVLAVYKPGKKLGLQAGVEFSTLLSAKVKSNGKDEDVKDFYKSSDLGLIGGLQLQLTESVTLDARYIYGISAVNNNEIKFTDTVGNEIGSVSYNNQTIQVSLAYLFLR